MTGCVPNCATYGRSRSVSPHAALTSQCSSHRREAKAVGLTTVFLDRDGVLNRALEGDYVKSPDELELLDGAVEGVRLLNEHGMLVLVVTNQRGIALGRMSALDLERVHA